MSGPSTPKHSKDKRERKRAAGRVELRMYVPATEHESLREMIKVHLAWVRILSEDRVARSCGALGNF